jgi:hypothetical protein
VSGPYLHSPDQCNNYAVMQKPKFSHSNFIKIMARRIVNFWRVSTPYLSGDLFATMVDYAPWRSRRFLFIEALRSLFLRKTRDFEPKIDLRRLGSANSIFIPSHKMESFVQNYQKYIKAKVIICGNSDFNFTEIPLIPNSVQICLLQNSAVSDNQKIFTLPIGLENLSLGRAGLTRFHKKMSSHTIYERILVPPMSPTNKERYNALIWGRENPGIADTFFTLLPLEQYFDLARRYKFILCSEGNGFENHRIWESLYQGSFPVLMRTSWSESLAYLGLPILFVESYAEITSDLLHNFYITNKSFDPAMCSWLWEDTWKKFINQELDDAHSVTLSLE